MKLTVGAVVLPGTSKKTKTGLWRATRPVVNTKTCNGCGICVLFCPDSSISIADKTCQIDYEYCKGCGICAHECSQKAITMQEEGK
ncbi:MAG: 4Fe-4S binding protein [Syntrophomonadaceae bacterium]|jgi:pyruvate ferredoxin oxidoreductase delta subunit|nr:4Fe-4S binding protein [Syntrophomonadaceae bacterium]